MNKQWLIFVIIAIFGVLTQAQQTKKYHDTKDRTREPLKRVADGADDADSSKDVTPRCGPRCKNGTIEWPIRAICKMPEAPPAPRKVWCACPSNCNSVSFVDNSADGGEIIDGITGDVNEAYGATAGFRRTTRSVVTPSPKPRNCCGDEKSLVPNGWCVCPEGSEGISGAVPLGVGFGSSRLVTVSDRAFQGTE